MIDKFLRHMHQILGLLLFWMIMMYAVSAVQMAHRMRIVPVVTESDVMVPTPDGSADAALFVVSAAEGVDPATTALWQECASVGMPT